MEDQFKKLSFMVNNENESGQRIMDSFAGTVIKIHEPVGVIGISCPDTSPLLSFVSLFGAAIARSNSVVIVPSEKYPILALDMYQVRRSSEGHMTIFDQHFIVDI